MARLSFDQVANPSFAGVNDATRLMGELLNRGFGTMQGALDDLQTQATRRSSNRYQTGLMKYQDPEALRAAQASGELFEGINVDNLSQDAIKFGAGRVSDLLGEAKTASDIRYTDTSTETNQFKLGRSRVEAARGDELYALKQQMDPIANQIRYLTQIGDRQGAHTLLMQNQEGLARAGYGTGFLDGNLSAADAGRTDELDRQADNETARGNEVRTRARQLAEGLYSRYGSMGAQTLDYQIGELARDESPEVVAAVTQLLSGVRLPDISASEQELRRRGLWQPAAAGTPAAPQVDIAKQNLAARAKAAGKGYDHIEGMTDGMATGLDALFNSAPEHIRAGLQVGSGVRTRQRQQELWDASDKTGRTVARPGHSRHEFGSAVDIWYNGQRLDKAPREVQEYIHANAERFGLRFPMSYEPWHIETIDARSGGDVRSQVQHAGNDLTFGNQGQMTPEAMYGLEDMAPRSALTEAANANEALGARATELMAQAARPQTLPQPPSAMPRGAVQEVRAPEALLAQRRMEEALGQRVAEEVEAQQGPNPIPQDTPEAQAGETYRNYGPPERAVQEQIDAALSGSDQQVRTRAPIRPLTEVDPEASRLVQVQQESARHMDSSQFARSISDRIRVGNANERASADVADFATLPADSLDASIERRNMQSEASDWFRTPDARRFFADNPQEMERADANPVEWYESRIVQGVNPTADVDRAISEVTGIPTTGGTGSGVGPSGAAAGSPEAAAETARIAAERAASQEIQFTPENIRNIPIQVQSRVNQLKDTIVLDRANGTAYRDAEILAGGSSSVSGAEIYSALKSQYGTEDTDTTAFKDFVTRLDAAGASPGVIMELAKNFIREKKDWSGGSEMVAATDKALEKWRSLNNPTNSEEEKVVADATALLGTVREHKQATEALTGIENEIQQLTANYQAAQERLASNPAALARERENYLLLMEDANRRIDALNASGIIGSHLRTANPK